MNPGYLLLGIAVMALTTYIIRMIPLAVFRKKISNRWLRSFLYYVPYAVLSAMTFPAVFYCTESEVSALAGCAVAVLLAYYKKGLLTVAVGAAAAVYLVQLLGW